jgi:hypothetical protein
MITLKEDELKGKKVLRIKKVGVLSLAKICAFLYLIPGLIIGIYLSIEFSRFPPMMTDTILSWLSNRGAFLTYPLAYGVGGFVFGLLGGLFYNFLSRKIGGIEIEIE